VFCWGALWLAGAGCAGGGAGGGRAEHDPFFGVPPDRPAASAARSDPSPDGPPSNAALAAGQRPSLGVRLGPPSLTPAPGGSGGWAGPGGVQLQSPTLTGGPASRSNAAPGSGQIVGTFEQAQAHLRSAGVTWQRLECGDDGEWQFSCAVPRRNGLGNRRYETRDRTPLGALQRALDQIASESR
jgi:hypothetical protein